MDSFVFWPRQDPLGQTELFAHEVAPAVREAVEAERGKEARLAAKVP